MFVSDVIGTHIEIEFLSPIHLSVHEMALFQYLSVSYYIRVMYESLPTKGAHIRPNSRDSLIFEFEEIHQQDFATETKADVRRNL